jgi:hypothetical protein
LGIILSLTVVVIRSSVCIVSTIMLILLLVQLHVPIFSLPLLFALVVKMVGLRVIAGQGIIVAVILMPLLLVRLLLIWTLNMRSHLLHDTIPHRRRLTTVVVGVCRCRSAN